MKTYDEFYNFSRSTVLKLLETVNLIVRKLLMEIREDNFSMKFNLNHLNETTGKIYKGCSDISGEFKDLHMKNSIDMRASCQAIDIGF